MLATEFEQEWSKQATGERFAPPKQLRLHESEYIRAFYQRSELDSIVFGADRQRMTMDTITINGLTFAVDIEHDADMGEPWKEHDGHGIVSEWTTRDKRPGERVLCADRGSKRYYDFAATVKIALKDCWGGEGRTKRERAANAVERDYQRMKAWCNDEWHWCGIVVTLLDDDGERVMAHSGSLWGIESDWSEGIEEEARAIAGELIHDIEQERAVEHGYAACGVYA